MAAFDATEFALKLTCPGNRLIYDSRNVPSVMVYVPKFKMSQVISGGANDWHPAFKIGNNVVDGIWIGKYQSVMQDGYAYSLPAQDPKSNIKFDDAIAACTIKGDGWHMMTKAEYAALLLWCRNNGTEPKGNNNYGKDASESNYTAIPATYETYTPDPEHPEQTAERILHVLTGTGPLTWSHNQQASGIWDLNGNVSEWTGGIRTVSGELQIIANNNAAIRTNSQAADSALWKAIKASDGTLVAPGTSGTIKVDCVNSKPQYATTITTENENFHSVISDVTAASGISDAAKNLLVSLGLFPDGTAKTYNSDQLYFNNKAAATERLFHSGGYYSSGAVAGVGCCSGNNNTRAIAVASVGFRLAYYEI